MTTVKVDIKRNVLKDFYNNRKSESDAHSNFTP